MTTMNPSSTTTTQPTNTTSATPETTTSLTPTTNVNGVTSTTSSPSVGDYTPELGLAFVRDCIQGQDPSVAARPNRRSYCECAYDEIVRTIPYSEFLEISDEVNSGRDIKTTKVGPIIDACAAKYPGAG
jgi:hypothetical protein